MDSENVTSLAQLNSESETNQKSVLELLGEIAVLMVALVGVMILIAATLGVYFKFVRHNSKFERCNYYLVFIN